MCFRSVEGNSQAVVNQEAAPLVQQAEEQNPGGTSNFFKVIMTAIKVVAAFSSFVCFIALLATRDADIRFYCSLSVIVLAIAWIIDPDFGEESNSEQQAQNVSNSQAIHNVLSSPKPTVQPNPAVIHDPTPLRIASPITVPATANLETH